MKTFKELSKKIEEISKEIEDLETQLNTAQKEYNKLLKTNLEELVDKNVLINEEIFGYILDVNLSEEYITIEHYIYDYDCTNTVLEFSKEDKNISFCDIYCIEEIESTFIVQRFSAELKNYLSKIL